MVERSQALLYMLHSQVLLFMLRSQVLLFMLRSQALLYMLLIFEHAVFATFSLNPS